LTIVVGGVPQKPLCTRCKNDGWDFEAVRMDGLLGGNWIRSGEGIFYSLIQCLFALVALSLIAALVTLGNMRASGVRKSGVTPDPARGARLGADPQLYNPSPKLVLSRRRDI
jgi:hypothetical protein